MSEKEEKTAAVAPPPDSMEMIRYKEEMAKEMGLPSPYGMSLMKQVAKDMVESGMVPGVFKNNPMAVYMAAMRGKEMGLSPMESVMETFFPAPGGRLGMFANKMLDLLHRGLVETEFRQETAANCTIMMSPPKPHQPYLATFDFEEARVAGLVKPDSNYIKWPRDMCKARAIARGWRALIGTFKGGSNMYVPEEMDVVMEQGQDGTYSAPQDDQRRMEVLQAQEDFRVGIKPQPGEVVVEPEKPTAAAAPSHAPAAAPAAPIPPPPPEPVAEVFTIYLAEHGPVLGETPQKDIATAMLRAQALANQLGAAHEVWGSKGRLHVAKPPVNIRPAPAHAPAAAATPAPPAPPPPAPVPPPAPAPAAEKKAEGKGSPESKAMLQRLTDLVPVLDPKPDAPKKTWVQRMQAFVAGYLGVDLKGLPRKAAEWEEPVTDLERLLAHDQEVFRSGPEMAGKSRRRRHEELLEALRAKWPTEGEGRVRALALALADQWDLDAANFIKWIETNQYDFLPEVKGCSPLSELESVLRLSLVTRNAHKVAKLSKAHNLAITYIVGYMEKEQLGYRLDQATAEEADRQIAVWERDVQKLVKAPEPAAAAPVEAGIEEDELESFFSSL